VAEQKRKRGTGLGLAKGLSVTLKTMLKPAITQAYPHVKPDLPARTRGVIALKQENCTVCWKCSRECPDWCIYIESHKETHPPASGGRARSVKVLDRFAIDYALCMYCGICVEVCPFDALFWAPDFEYAEYDLLNMTHEKERLEEWTYRVLPPPMLEEGAEAIEAVESPEEPPVATGGGEPVASRPPSACTVSRATMILRAFIVNVVSDTSPLRFHRRTTRHDHSASQPLCTEFSRARALQARPRGEALSSEDTPRSAGDQRALEEIQADGVGPRHRHSL